MTMFKPTQEEKDQALRLAIKMAAAQRTYYGLPRDDSRKRMALQVAQAFERDFARLTKDWEIGDAEQQG